MKTNLLTVLLYKHTIQNDSNATSVSSKISLKIATDKDYQRPIGYNDAPLP